MSCHSFYPTKNLGALGDAGAICTNDKQLYENIKVYRNLGCPQKYIHTMKATNARLDPLQAAFLSLKLKTVDDTISKKQTIAQRYVQELPCRHIKNSDRKALSSYHLFVIQVDKRDALSAYLAGKGIETIIHYPIPFYKSEAFKEYNHLTFDHAEHLSSTILSIPMHCLLTEEQIRTIVLHINAFYTQ
jgi:dTDP-4-amino-4,6-dideoxygalactose transaminase